MTTSPSLSPYRPGIRPDYPALIEAVKGCEFKSLLKEIETEAAARTVPAQGELLSSGGTAGDYAASRSGVGKTPARRGRWNYRARR